MILIYTGDGKGKTTASIGLCVRAAGNGLKVCVLQFLKSPDFKTGEVEFLIKNGIEVHTLGIGFSWQKDKEEQRTAVSRAWTLSKEKLCDPAYDLIVLDEINNVFANKDFEWQDIMPLQDVAQFLREQKDKHIVLTGRGAPGELIEIADLVTEMKCVKHYYQDGTKAMPGLEY